MTTLRRHALWKVPGRAGMMTGVCRVTSSTFLFHVDALVALQTDQTHTDQPEMVCGVWLTSPNASGSTFFALDPPVPASVALDEVADARTAALNGRGPRERLSRALRVLAVRAERLERRIDATVQAARSLPRLTPAAPHEPDDPTAA